VTHELTEPPAGHGGQSLTATSGDGSGVRREPRAAAKRRERTGAVLFAFVLLVYGATAGGSLATTDAVVTYTLTRQIVEHGSVALPGDLLGNAAHRGPDGRYYSPFGLAQSVYNIPYYLAGRAAARHVADRIGRHEAIEKAAVALGNGLPMAATVWVVYLFGRDCVRRRSSAVAAALAAAFATPAWPYAKFGFNVPLSALALTAAGYLAWRATRRKRSSVPVGLLLSLALLTRHELLLAVLPIGLWFAVERDSARDVLRRLFGLAAGLAPGVLIWLAYNYMRFGNVLDAGYLRDPIPQFGSSVLWGGFGLLLSPTGSLLVYAPLTVVSLATVRHVWRADRRLLLLLLAPLAVFVVFYAQLGNWMGGRSYGPRYLVPMLPLTVVTLAFAFDAAATRARRQLAAVCAACVVVQLPGVLVDFAKVGLQHARAHGAPTRDERLHDWTTAPIVLNARASVAAVSRTVRVLSGADPVPARRITEPDDRDFSQQFVFSLDFWWVYLCYMGVIPRAMAVGIGLGLMAAAAGLAWMLDVHGSR
jgi:Dolichyl-phosphate-mannose-protein mannosyltransferase